MANLQSRWQFTVKWADCDPNGMVFDSRFFEYFDWGTWTLFERALGVKPQELAGAYGILGIPLVDAGARFHAAARFGDVVALTSEVKEFRRSSFEVQHRLMIGEVLAVDGRETRVWAVRDVANPARIKALPVPAQVTARFQIP